VWARAFRLSGLGTFGAPGRKESKSRVNSSVGKLGRDQVEGLTRKRQGWRVLAGREEGGFSDPKPSAYRTTESEARQPGTGPGAEIVAE